jgi:predicted ATP-grasp superfamily ATP-dependent carboligase
VRLFVCEYVTGDGLSGAPLPPGLRREGDMMLGTLVKDLGDVPGVEVVSTRDARLPVPDCAAAFRPIGAGEDPWPVWRRLAGEVDAVWPVAPETGGALERLSEMAHRQLGARQPAGQCGWRRASAWRRC